MAYNSSKGPQQHGDVKFEDDPEDTQIDFENDFIALKTNGVQRFIISGSHMTASISLSSSAAADFKSLNINGARATISDAGAFTATSLTASQGIRANEFSAVGHMQAPALIATGAGIISGSGQGSFENLRLGGGTATVSNVGVASFGGSVTAVGSFIIGSADLNEADMEKLDGITNGTGAANKALVLDANSKIASGLVALTASEGIRANEFSAAGHVQAPALIAVGGAGIVSGSGQGSFDSINIGGGRASVSNVGAITAVSITASAAGHFQSLAIHGNRASIDANGALNVREITASAGIKVASITGSKGLYDLTNGTLQIGNEEVGTGGIVKISTTTDNSIPLMVRTPSHQTILGVTGSGKVTVGGVLLNAKLNVTGSDLDMLFEAKSNTRDPVFRIEGNGQTLISGSLIVKNALPSIYFSSSHSPGTPLGQIGINSSDNILIQNDTINKHIVLKVNDNGTTREGFRVNGAVPEVVVNEGADSLVDFRVESNNNTHMLFVDGGTDKVGINTATPGDSLSVVGSTHLSGTVRLHTALKTANYSLGTSDRVVVFNPTNGVTASLPTLTAATVGLTYTIKNISAHMIQVSASNTQEDFIDGLTTHDLPPGGPGSGSFVTVCGYAIGAGFDWAVIGKN